MNSYAVKNQRRRERRPSVRRSVTLSAEIDKRVRSIAKSRRSSTNSILEDLIEAGLTAKEEEKRRFFDLAERFRSATDPKEIAALKSQLSRTIFGE